MTRRALLFASFLLLLRILLPELWHKGLSRLFQQLYVVFEVIQWCAHVLWSIIAHLGQLLVDALRP